MSELNAELYLKAQHSQLDNVLAELKAGKKQSHWMWYFFPQIEGLGQSPTAIKYALNSLEQANEYDRHQLLGGRLRQLIEILLKHDLTAEQIFGYPDYLKFHSCLTLFNQACPKQRIYSLALQYFYRGQKDQKTLDILKKSEKPNNDPLIYL